MAAETLAPSIYAIFLGNATADDEFVIAAHADIVVSSIALQTVIPCI
jgi:hypothetical protein